MGSKSLAKEAKALVRAAEVQGFTVKEKKNGWMGLYAEWTGVGDDPQDPERPQGSEERSGATATLWFQVDPADKGEGMREFRITITVSDHGHRDVAEDRMERLLEAFEQVHPEAGAVLGANFHLGRLDATFSVDAKDAQEATQRGWDVFVEAAVEAELEPSEVIEINAVAVGETSVEESDRELVGAT